MLFGGFLPQGLTVRGPIVYPEKVDSWAPDSWAPGPNCPGPNYLDNLGQSSHLSICFVPTNRSLAPNLRQMAKQRTGPAFFQLFAEITKLLSLF